MSATPTEVWESYKAFVFDEALTEQQEFECKRAFFAGSEAVFKILDRCAKSNLRTSQTIKVIRAYQEMNSVAAMETIDDEQEETL